MDNAIYRNYKCFMISLLWEEVDLFIVCHNHNRLVLVSNIATCKPEGLLQKKRKQGSFCWLKMNKLHQNLFLCHIFSFLKYNCSYSQTNVELITVKQYSWPCRSGDVFQHPAMIYFNASYKNQVMFMLFLYVLADQDCWSWCYFY